ncbi:MAG: peptidoglycan recognition protein family protein [Planctomycetaceae bacterium]|nr:peptidoglycan recognition protein family protein [Planctomycetaceae bacterium]
MFKKILIFIVAAYVPTITVMFAGCAEEDSYTPQITGSVPTLRHDYSSYRRSYSTYKPSTTTKTYSSPYKVESGKSDKSTASSPWAPPSNVERSWKAIVIHHSATDTGNVASIDDYHRNNNGWDGIGYDFIIGNGSGCGNGEVDSTFRWTGQKTGAHCKTDSSNWANEKAIGICLIGNFNKTRPSSSQMSSLLKLVRFLAKRYDVPASRIYGHNTTPGHSTKTECPGKNFSMSYLKANL